MSIWIGTVKSNTSPLNFMLAISRPYLFVASTAALCSVFATALETAGAYIFKKIVDVITLGGVAQVNEAWHWAIIYVVFFLFLPLVLWRSSGFAGMRWVTGVRATASHTLSSYVTRHSHDYFHNRFAGALGSKIANTSQSASSLVEKFLWSQIILVVTLITSFVLAFQASTVVGFLFVAWLAVSGPISFYLARKNFAASALVQREDTHVRARIIDLLTNIGAMHDFARRTFELSQLKPAITLRRTAGIKNWTIGEISRIASNVIQVVFVCGIVSFSIHAWSTGQSSAGDIVLVLALIANLGYRMEELGRNINDFAQNYGEISENLDDLLNVHEVADAEHAVPLVVKDGRIEFVDVSFRYKDGSRNVLSDFELHAEPGQKIGLVGKSGAGKSTLVKLLLRHYDLTSGAIEIDGQNIKTVTQESVRAAISTVPQEPLLFHRTIRENIAYGKAGATEEEIIEAAKLARADDFIRQLPLKYDTMVGERGVKLSGGERQRVALARAILKPAKILVLDEATSALDSESEAAIQQALETLMEGKTVIAIAHRLSTLSKMDRIIVLDEGKVVEDGTHKQLLKKKGIYAELWSHQSGGYIQDEEEVM
jgi:ABC-type multidrug transport system fused ATPase/permease subunit